MNFQKPDLEPSPELKAWPISRLLLCWVIPLLKKGSKQNLELEDVYHSLPEDSSEKVGSLLEKKWNEEIILANQANRPPKLWKAIARIIFRKYGLIGVGYSFDELVLRIIQPLALRSFIKTFNTDDITEEQSLNLRRDQCICVSVLILVSLVDAVMYHKLIREIIHIGMRMRVGVSSLIYRKILKLDATSSENRSIGKLCNLLSTDVGHLHSNLINLHFFYIAPLQLLISTYLLWNELGLVATSTGLAVILFLSPMQVLVGRFAMYFRTRIAKRSDDRGRFVNEVVTGIRLIKMYCYEKSFAALIAKLRKVEIEFIRKSLYMKGIHLSVKVVAMKLIPFCALMVYAVGMGEPLTADKAFFSMLLFTTMLQAVTGELPNASQDLGVLMVSLNRIEEFLLSSDKSSTKFEKVYQFSENGASVANRNTKDDEPIKETFSAPKVEMRNFSASWTLEKETLKNLNINLTGKQLVMVIGPVGSGKSSFLNAILGEMPVTSFDKETDFVSSYFQVQGRLSYASQQAWIFPASVRQNILFGLPLDEARYWNIIKLCCLEEDLKQFPDGDLTLVGERGLMLSGGQRSRVSMARALYQKADIYLLDDILASVDTKVGQRLFEECIKGHLDDTMRILVTHELKYLSMADHIIFLNRDGSILDQGSYEHLKNSIADFDSLIGEQHSQSVIENKNVGKGITDGSKHDDVKPSVSTKVDNLEKEESKKVGTVEMNTYFKYFQTGASYLLMVILAFTFLAKQIVQNFTDLWVSRWTNAVALESSSTGNFSDDDDPVTSSSIVEVQKYYAFVYSGLMVGFIFLTMSRSLLFFNYCMRISVNLHNKMFSSVIRAPVKFFDDNPSGRIMNRFTKDLNLVDERLPEAFYVFINALFNLLGMLAVNISANYYTALPSALFLVGLWKLRSFFLKTSRDLKRIEAVAKSPLFTHVTMTMQGLTTIRALKAQKRVMGQFEQIQDTHTSAFYLGFTTNRWFSIWLEIMVVVYLGVVAVGFLILTTSSEGGNVGVALSAILGLAGAIQWGVRQSAETSNYMTSVERILEYSKLKLEAPVEMDEDLKIKDNWPSNGQVTFQNVCLAYDDMHKNRVLNSITFSTHSKEKIGIVGRTGAGKSSLLTALFRLTELCNGRILIDGVVTNRIGLTLLRSRISIIPQDPVLFSGTIRYNLDPFNEFEDYQLWSVLREVDMHRQVQNLDCRVADGGSNFSVGERQLLCLARAIVRNNKIIVLDEATANVDHVTDQLVQQTIRDKFSECTILTIAHRVKTIMDSDRIMVMDAGEIVVRENYCFINYGDREFDSPQELLANENGVFYTMVHQCPPT